jgi:hypothetical protein
MNAFLNTSYLFRFFPWVRSLVGVAPFLAPYMTGDIGILMKEMYINTPERIRQARRDYEAGVVRKRPSVFTDILASSLPEHEKTVDRLSGEGFSLTGAGTETTAVSLVSTLAEHVSSASVLFLILKLTQLNSSGPSPSLHSMYSLSRESKLS